MNLDSDNSIQTDTSTIFLPQCGHITFVMFSTKVIGISQFLQFQVGISISKLYEEIRSILWNNYMRIVLVESVLLDEVSVFYQDHHQLQL